MAILLLEEETATFETYVSHIENFQFIFQLIVYIKYECFFQELEMTCVFAIKFSINI